MGEATARAIVKHGGKVALFDLNEQRGAALANELSGVYCKVNIADQATVIAGFEKARAANGQERILVNCAGTGNAIKTVGRDKKTGAIKKFPLDKFRAVIEVNLVGTFACIVESAAGMLTLDLNESGDRGVIINTASVAAEDGQQGQASYASSKAGLVGLTLPVARDLAGEGIRINTILPGLFDTPMMAGAPDHLKAALAAQVLFPKRLGRAEEYASLALEMIRNAYFNGEDVRLDGAIRMSPR
jgi:NAD(P)-dependent dehydrogenase (short-subunit alcohol dehydrogenase family)